MNCKNIMQFLIVLENISKLFRKRFGGSEKSRLLILSVVWLSLSSILPLSHFLCRVESLSFSFCLSPLSLCLWTCHRCRSWVGC